MPDPNYEAQYGPGPHLTADAVVIRRGEIALIRRKKGGQWALPGGFLDKGETFFDCAMREFKEEAGVDLEENPSLIAQIWRPVAFDEVDRDPRSRIITAGCKIELSKFVARPLLTPGDDADRAEWFSLGELPPLYADHATIIRALSF